MENTLNNVLLSALFALLGFVLLFIGYRVFDALTPTDLSKRVFEDGNVAAALLASAFVLGLAVIIAAAVG